MPLWLFPTIFAVAIIVTLISGIWLLLHLTALARTFSGNADVVPSPKRPHASRTAVRIALIAFTLGLLVTLTMQVLSMTGIANVWIEQT